MRISNSAEAPFRQVVSARDTDLVVNEDVDLQ